MSEADFTNYAPLFLISLGCAAVVLGIDRLLAKIYRRVFGLALFAYLLLNLIWIEYYHSFQNYPRPDAILSVLLGNPSATLDYVTFFAGWLLYLLVFSLLLILVCAQISERFLARSKQSIGLIIAGCLILLLGQCAGRTPNLAQSFGVAQHHSTPTVYLTSWLLNLYHGQDILTALDYRPQSNCTITHTEAKNKKPNIFLVVMESLRADHFPFYGYSRNTTPLLLQEQQKWLVFENYYSSAPITHLAFYSILSGSYSIRSNTELADQGVNWIWQELERHGYLNLALSSSTFQWGKIKSLFPTELVQLIDLDNLPKDFEIPIMIDPPGRSIDDWHIISWLRNLILKNKPANRPIFSVLCPQAVHYPYRARANLARFASGDARIQRGAHTYVSLKADAQGKRDQYDDSIVSFDNWINGLESLLDEQGILEDSLIIVTGDHAESLGEQGIYYHGHELTDTQIKVPLLIRVGSNYPALNLALRSNSQRLASHIDLAATLTRIAGSSEPKHADGVSLVDQCSKPYEIIPYNFLCSKLAVINQDSKFIYDLDLYESVKYNRKLSETQQSASIYSERQSISEFLKSLEAEGIVAEK